MNATSVPSGIGWLGDIPNQWKMRRLKYIVDFCGGGTPSKDEEAFWGGDIPWVSPKDMRASLILDSEDHITAEAVRASATREVPAGSVLVVVRSGILRHTIPVAIAGRPVTLNQDMKALIPHAGVESRYLRYVINGRQHALLLAWRKAGATVESIEHDLLANTVFPVPPYGDQQAIADFLDEKTAAIDALIAKEERLIGLIEEKRKAAITRAVTKGLDPDVPMKDSGTGWLGAIPNQWQMRRLKYIVDFCGGGTPSKDEDAFWGGDIPWVSPKDIRASVILDSEDHITEEAVRASATREVPAGSILVVVRSGILRHTIPVAIAGRPVTLNQDMKALIPRSGVEARYLRYVIHGWQHALLWAWRKAGATVESIEHDLLANTVFPIPPHRDQQAIADFLDEKTATIGVLIANKKRLIEKLREYRQTLISAAVTGQIDVRSGSARTDEVLQEALA